ncbi:MAG: cyclic pyranopterin monophosphate synthase MoaC [Candidatus Methanofastidiosia archaeon]
MKRLTHSSREGIKMVDISEKKVTKRLCIASGEIKLKGGTIDSIQKKRIKKGDVLLTAQVAGILAAKRVSELIPLCHQVPLEKVEIDFEVLKNKVVCECRVLAQYKTGVEMEALAGVSVALLTVWDMVKALEKDSAGQYPETLIDNLKVIRKEKIL